MRRSNLLFSIFAPFIPTNDRLIIQIPCCTPGFWGYLPTMDWQQMVSLFIVAVTACALIGRKFRGQRFSFERDTHCGCAAVSRSAPQTSIIFRARKGQRPEVL